MMFHPRQIEHWPTASKKDAISLLEIKEIKQSTEFPEIILIYFVNSSFLPLPVYSNFCSEFDPKPGDYLVNHKNCFTVYTKEELSKNYDIQRYRSPQEVVKILSEYELGNLLLERFTAKFAEGKITNEDKNDFNDLMKKLLKIWLT